ncbi:metal-binding protein [Leptolyngbya sp. AN02str]|uniref:metal-binding protein n=1 Tax=Leptolyngbya sp. AN02str TaxID=3423363 RepID=UPI003D314D1E
MPSGRTHDRITLWTLPLVGAGSLLATNSSSLTLVLCGGYLFGGLMFGPDLDVRSVQFKRWGWFRWIWLPYRGSMKHRSPLSHSPITGTFLRIVYLLSWLALLSLLLLGLMNQIWQLGWTWGDIAGVMGRSLSQHRNDWLSLVLGVELGALSHYGADWSTSTWKRVQTKGWKAAFPSSPKRKRSPPRRKKRPNRNI